MALKKMCAGSHFSDMARRHPSPVTSRFAVRQWAFGRIQAQAEAAFAAALAACLYSRTLSNEASSTTSATDR
jgi:hypothetical protein